jgi:hypothetical protein
MRHLLLLLLTIATVAAHDVSESYLRLDIRENRITGIWEVALRDLEIEVGLDANADDLLTWGEVLLARPKIEARVRTALLFRGATGLTTLSKMELNAKARGSFLAIAFDAPVGRDWSPSLEYRFLFDFDRSHRAIATIVRNETEKVALLTAAQSNYQADAPPRTGFMEFMRQGVIHIWEGTDHILFLVALLLPAVIRRGSEKIRFREALMRVVRIVTAFTIAHSITLCVAACGWIQLPGRFVESVIAFSVLLAAANNIMRIWDDRSWLLAFLFGLIHGFGFASVLAELNLGSANLLASLIGFNAGVEAGQIAIVLVFVPIAFLIRETWVYRRLVVMAGSSAIMLVASCWMIERAFSVALFSTISTLLP